MFFSILRVGVIVSVTFSIVSLATLIIRTFSFGKRTTYAKAQGKAGDGIIYAFGRGMMPWEKESAAKHLPTFTAGIIYHMAIFSAILFVIALLIPISVSSGVIQIIRLILIAGLLCGMGLLIKRFLLPYMRGISCLDDFLSNLIVDLFLMTAFLATLSPDFVSPFFIMAIITFLYIPMGKIRHCFFFFYTRIIFGRYFGRRGVLPHPSRET